MPSAGRSGAGPSPVPGVRPRISALPKPGPTVTIGTAMVHSMTAFAREDIDAEWGAAAWELRSVNHRYLDVSLRLPEELRSLDAEVRKRVAARVRRGKVECSLRIQPYAGGEHGLEIDERLLDRLLAAQREIETRSGQPLRAPSTIEILRWPGVVEPNRLDRESVQDTALQLLEHALASLVDARTREGMKLAELLERRCGEISGITSGVREILPEVQDGYGARLRARFEEARLDLDESRLAQELVMFASRTDVAEELDRLDAHLGEVREALASPPPIGRRLDFLMQELHREANTLGSKSTDARLTRSSVDLKVLIEQMREQVQNIE